MKLKKVVSCLLATAIAAGGVMSGAANYSYLRSGIVSAAVSAPASTTVLKETAYVTWTAISGADGYNVYVKPEGGSYTQLDSMLIRQYNGYYRADAVGLKAGNYIMKVVPTSGGKEDTSKAIESSSMKVESYDRSGFAFSNMSEGVGAYNADGTLKSNAVVLYVTEETKNTITMDVQTASSKTTSCTGISEILKALQKGYETRPIAIRLIGKITASGMTGSGDTNNLLLKASSEDSPIKNITVEGIGDDTTCYGFGIRAQRAKSIEVRNLAVMLFGDDGIALETANKNIWIHNNDIFYGSAGSDADQVKGDGSMDLKNDSQNITISYNHFWDSGKMSLCGMKSETGENWISYHHNWFDHSDSRHPRIRTMSVHVYNNYYDGNSKYGVGTTMGSDAFVESNYFRNCKYPMLISMQGSDEGTFSSEDGGMIKAYGNYMEGQKAFVPYSENNTEFDAYVVSNKSDTVPSSVKCVKGGDTYNNFDTSSSMYSYTADAAADVPSIVMAESGRLNGGDFDWEFNDSVDDADYDVNTELMAAIKSYDDSIVAIGSGFKSSAEVVEPTQAPSEVTTTTTSKTTNSTTTTTKTTTASTPSGEENVPSGVKILGAGGWNEMMYLMASGISDADVTAVSWSGASTGSLTGDDLKYLVRDVNGNLRVDVVGLKPGTYTLSLTTSKGTVSKSGIVVGAQDRSGFAHYNYTSGVGAYNDDGTLKANAVVLYVTDENKDTVTVTSKDGTTVKGIGNILNSAGQDNGSGATSKGGTPNTNSDIIEKLAKDGTPLVIRIVGNVTAPAGVTEFDSVNYGGSVGDNGYMARMQSGKDVTIEGIGTDACINGWGIHFIAETANTNLGKSFEVRNIAFRNVPEDCLGMEGQQGDDALTAPVERCWIHNCEFYAPKISNPAESDKDGGDGACDFKRGQYFTNSYCYYEGYHKTNLVGSSDTSLQYHLTYHHNYWKSCESRGPLARQADIHMYNNVYDGQTSYCQNPRANAFIFSEYNYFTGCKDVCEVTSGGVVKSYMDTIENCRGNAQATVVTDKSKTVSSSCKYANFDTNASISYIPSGNYYLQTNTADLKATFETDGGCMDEMSISGNNPIVTTVTTGGGSDVVTTTKTTVVSDPITVPAGGVVHNFTLNDKDSTFYTISGNLSTSKGTVSYAGLTLTQCLKMETATSIKFSNSVAGEITLVFAEAGKTVKIDGTKYTTDANGIVTATVAAGSHEITKGDAINLFYMVYTDASSGQTTTTVPVTTPVTTTTTTVVTTPGVTETAPATTTKAIIGVTTTVSTAPVTTVSTTKAPVTTQAPVTTEPIATTPAPTENLPDGSFYGDVNCDGVVDVADIVALNMYLLNASENKLDEASKANADCARDNVIDSADSVLLMNYVAMIIKDTALGVKQ